jgi:predicted outer membrane repeat protein
MIGMRTIATRAVGWVFVSLVAALAGAMLVAAPAAAGGEVGNGNPSSCYEAALDVKLAGGGLVTFNCGSTPHTILVTTYKTIQDDTEIRGGGVITLSGGNTTPLFQVFAGKTLILRDLGLTHGSGTFGAIENFGHLHISGSRLTENYADAGAADGGALVNFGSLNMTNTVLSQNHAGGSGGAIYNDAGGTLTLRDSQVYSNSAVDGGGALLNLGTATLANNTLRANQAVYSGGGIGSAGVLTLSNVIFQDNRLSTPALGYGAALTNGAGGSVVANAVQFVGNAGSGGSRGGGVYNQGLLQMTGATFARNQAYRGGAVVNDGAMILKNALVYTNTTLFYGVVINSEFGSLTLVNVTLSDNAGGGGWNGGVANIVHGTVVHNRGSGVIQGGSGQLRLQNSVVADNSPTNCDGIVTSDGHNLSSDASCAGWNQPGDQTEKPAQLGPLADNGGPTLTHLPQSGSPLIDGGQCLPDVLTDQRGVARPFGAACDIGAVEWARLLAFLPVVRR